MTLREVFQHAKHHTFPEGWLYLPTGTEWKLNTNGSFLDWEKKEKDADNAPLIAKRHHLREAFDNGTLEDVVDWADRLAGKDDDSARLDVFRYYFRFDAFPDKLGAPDPPPAAEIMRLLDRQFYDALGAEHAATKCRHDGCNRCPVNFSVFCRVHHFEQIKKRPSPFHD